MSAHQFGPADAVECIEESNSDLVEGKRYTVAEAGIGAEDLIVVKGSDKMYRPTRFKLLYTAAEIREELVDDVAGCESNIKDETEAVSELASQLYKVACDENWEGVRTLTADVESAAADVAAALRRRGEAKAALKAHDDFVAAGSR